MQQTRAHPLSEQRIRMSYEEYQQLDESTHAEWVHGEVIFFMPPSIRHQDLSWFLATLLGLYVRRLRLGRVLTTPVEMWLEAQQSAREPDILYIARTNFDRLRANRLHGPADLVVELVSPESAARDRIEKFHEYQSAGVREYWVVDPRPGEERIDLWILDNTNRFRPAVIRQDGIYHSTVIPGFWLNINWLWQDDLADPLPYLEQIFANPSA